MDWICKTRTDINKENSYKLKTHNTEMIMPVYIIYMIGIQYINITTNFVVSGRLKKYLSRVNGQ